ncbi:MAG: DUF1778 domain-containing protein [Chloroflexi bacterium]|nr:DUF1778 domain-containing protein [Chloroflexota bacterium]
MDEQVANAADEASADPADRRVFVLPSDRWDEFVAMLDREPMDRPRLAALLLSPSSLDARE